MSKDIRIKKEVFVKKDFDKVVDRSFNTFVDQIQENQVSVAEFFVLYDELFFEIPVKGEIGSHEYILNKSSTLIEIQEDTQDIQPLLDEIALLREQVLEYQQQIIELNNPNA